MVPISVKSPSQKVADQSEQNAASAQQLFKIRGLFATISLMSDPKTSLSLLCCSQKIYQSYTCRKEISKPDESAFEEVNKIFNSCLGIKIPKEGSPSAKLQQHQLHFDSTFKAAKRRIELRSMAMDEEIDRLCWGDLPLLKEWIAASDKLQVWKLLAEAINVEGPSAANLTEINSCIAEADKFSEWFGINIGELAALQVLSLRNNELAALPAEIGELAALQVLYLGGNKLAALPDEIGKLAALQALFLDYNPLAALPPSIGQLTSLEILNIDLNQLTALPPSIGKLAALKMLSLRANQLTELPAEIGKLAALELLNLGGNQLTELPAEIGKLAALERLDIDNNQLTALPPSIGKLAALRELYFEGNQLAALPAEIGKRKKNECVLI